MIVPNRASLVELAVRCLDLTSLGDITAQGVTALCLRARCPDPRDETLGSVAAVCVYPRFAAGAREALRGSEVRVAAVAGGFPSGVATIEERVEEIREAIRAGAQEIDTVLDRMLLGGSDGEPAAFEQLRASREAAGSATLKVILETGALESEGMIRQASELAIRAGADFLKTSTGVIGLGASPGATRHMMLAVRRAFEREGRVVGIKVAGGIRQIDDALGYLELARDVLGPEWLRPDRFRIGASSLLDALVEDRRRT